MALGFAEPGARLFIIVATARGPLWQTAADLEAKGTREFNHFLDLPEPAREFEATRKK
jgi:hypothetical protein